MTKQEDSLSLQDHHEKVIQPYPGMFHGPHRQQNQAQMPQPDIQGPVHASDIDCQASQASAVPMCKLTVTNGFMP